MNALSEDNSLVQMPVWRNPWLLVAMCVSLGLHAVILYVPFLAGGWVGGWVLGRAGGRGRGSGAAHQGNSAKCVRQPSGALKWRLRRQSVLPIELARSTKAAAITLAHGHVMR